MKAVAVKPNTPLFEQVVSLGDRSNATLGFLPRGAFINGAAAGNVLAATDETGEFWGYLLYRIVRSSQEVALVHLCVDPQHRGKKVGLFLLDALEGKTRATCYGIRLRCREDFEVSKYWPKVGFVSSGKRLGRSERGTQLIVWWKDFGHPNLFSACSAPNETADEAINKRIRLVIDANIFFDLENDRREEGRETRALKADWIGEVARLEFLVTPELRMDIQRPSATALGVDLSKVAEYGIVGEQVDRAALDNYTGRFAKVLFGNARIEGLNPNQLSDVRHLAYTLASGESTYLTRDGALLSRKADFWEEFHLEVLSPLDLIENLDELKDADKYKPILLQGGALVREPLRVAAIANTANRFANQNDGEAPPSLCRTLQGLARDPGRATIYTFRMTVDREDRALCGIEEAGPLMRIPLCRVHGKGTMASTWACGILKWAITYARQHGKSVIEFSDVKCGSDVDAALLKNEFGRCGSSRYKVIIDQVGNLQQLTASMTRLKNSVASISPSAAQAIAELHSIACRASTPQDGMELERRLDAMILGMNIRTCLIPIQARWAQDLFDCNLASNALFSSSDLTMRFDNVYYRSPHTNPALGRGTRILWYISKGKEANLAGLKSVRAVSICEEVAVDSGEKVFEKFRRLGVFERRHVKESTGKTGRCMAIRFAHTRLFESPVPLKEVRDSYRQHAGKTLTTRSVVEVPEEVLACCLQRGGVPHG